MLNALTSLLIAAGAAMAIASPAAAAPNCTDGQDIVYAGPFHGSFVSYNFDTSQFCDTSYTITAIDWPYGSNYVSFSGSYGYVDGIYLSPEIAVVTVTDGTDTDTFEIEITPCYDDDWPYDDECYL
jgi:hypothetical protein